MTRDRRPPNPPRSPCPIAGSLDLIGDRWTLLVIRDLFWGKVRYGEFQASPEGIPTNILAERLSRLEAAGIVTRKAYQDNPPRFEYALTRKGKELAPVLSSLVAWGKRNIPGTRTLAEAGREDVSAPSSRSAQIRRP
jgi:DNA-binding HxlR family transcriptional regulator